jgi:tRNA-2-methylthio-N6-dimethylallyladenosine synthase
VNSYGLDLKDGSNFADLLDKVASLGIPRVRFLTSYPSQFTDGMIDVMAKHENVMKWLHLPVQSGSDSCLRRMGRRYTREEYLDLVRRIRAKMPDIALTTDIIVGFPNETEEEFEDTLSLCREVSYSAAFTFIYSPRVGTPAARIKDDVPLSKKHERFNRLTEVIEETTSRHSESMVGRTFDVLVEGPSKRDKEVLSGYAENGKLINFRGPAYLQGAIVPVKVKESHTYSLIGELVGDPVILKARDVAFLLSKDPVLREYRSLKASLEDDPSIKELGERLEASKKALALSIGDKEEHAKRKKEYEAVLKEIRDHPLLHNEKALLSAVEERLLEVREALR